MSLYEELAKTVSKNWMDAFEKGFAERGFTEKIKTKDDYVIWLIQVGLFEDDAYPLGEDSPWS